MARKAIEGIRKYLRETFPPSERQAIINAEKKAKREEAIRRTKKQTGIRAF